MQDKDNLGNFFRENKKLAKEYIDTRLEIYRLLILKGLSKSAGYFIWIIVTLFLCSLIIIFLGLVTGFWMTNLTGSHTLGFGIATLFIVVLTVLIAAFRKALFINPIIRNIIEKTGGDDHSPNQQQ